MQLAFGLTIALTVRWAGQRAVERQRTTIYACTSQVASPDCALPPCLPPGQVLLEGNAMVLCSLIHASILKSGRQYLSSQEEAEFMARARQFALK